MSSVVWLVPGQAQSRVVNQIVVNHGTIPLDEIYFDLKPASTNLGELSHEQLIEGVPQSVVRNPDGDFQLFRIGDAVSARNTHAAIYDALRLLKDIWPPPALCRARPVR